MFQVNRKKNDTGRCCHFCQHFMRRMTQQTLLAINLVSQQKTTKLYFSSQVRKQFKLLAVPFKPLRCCLRNDKLVNCHVWKFCKDLLLNLRVIWSVNQIILFNGFLSDFVEITSCVYYSFQSQWIVALRIFTSPLSWLGKYLATIHLDFKEIIVNYSLVTFFHTGRHCTCTACSLSMIQILNAYM